MSVKEYCQYFRTIVESKPVSVGINSSSDSPTKVLTRTNSLFLTKLPSSRSQTRQLKCSGFFSPPHQPYKSFGILPDSHVFEWLARSFEINPPKNLLNTHQSVGAWKQIQQAQSTSPIIRVPILPSRQKGVGAATGTLRAGMSSLQLNLKAMDECRQKTYIGVPYKIVSSSFHIDKNDEKQLVAQRADNSRSVFINMMAGLAASRFKRPLERGVAKRSEVQNEEQYLCKLKAIFSILCCLHNMKSKDLKSKIPLQSSLLDYMSARHPLLKERNNLDSSLGSRPTQQSSLDKQRPPNIFESSRTPPWQMQIVFIDEKPEESKEDIQLRLESCYERFRQLKSDFSWKMKEEFEEREMNSSKLLPLKLQELSFGPNAKKQFKLMRERALYISRQETREQDNKPSWFLYLKTEISKALLTEETIAKGEGLMEQLNLFTTEETNSISHVLEKFCLLAMSTPAHHLCTLPVIEAIKFVLERILFTSSKLCKQWLELRQLPWQQYFY